MPVPDLKEIVISSFLKAKPNSSPITAEDAFATNLPAAFSNAMNEEKEDLITEPAEVPVSSPIEYSQYTPLAVGGSSASSSSAQSGAQPSACIQSQQASKLITHHHQTSPAIAPTCPPGKAPYNSPSPILHGPGKFICG